MPGVEGVWRDLAYGTLADQAEFTTWLEQRAASADPLFYAVVDWESMRAVGMAGYLRIKPEHGVIEIGHIWFAPELQRTRKATEAILLLDRTALDDLGYRRLEWNSDSLKVSSPRAANRLSVTFGGIFREHMIGKGSNQDTVGF